MYYKHVYKPHKNYKVMYVSTYYEFSSINPIGSGTRK